MRIVVPRYQGKMGVSHSQVHADTTMAIFPADAAISKSAVRSGWAPADDLVVSTILRP